MRIPAKSPAHRPRFMIFTRILKENSILKQLRDYRLVPRNDPVGPVFQRSKAALPEFQCEKWSNAGCYKKGVVECVTFREVGLRVCCDGVGRWEWV